MTTHTSNPFEVELQYRSLNVIKKDIRRQFIGYSNSVIRILDISKTNKFFYHHLKRQGFPVDTISSENRLLSYDVMVAYGEMDVPGMISNQIFQSQTNVVLYLIGFECPIEILNSLEYVCNDEVSIVEKQSLLCCKWHDSIMSKRMNDYMIDHPIMKYDRIVIKKDV